MSTKKANILKEYIPHQINFEGIRDKETERKKHIFVTKNLPISPTITKIEKTLHKLREINLHGTGSAVYKALKIASMVKSNSKGVIEADIKTRSIVVHDFTCPTAPGDKREIIERTINGVDIRLFYL